MRNLQDNEIPVGPAIITPDHVKDRVISPRAGSQTAWRRLSPHQAAYAKNKLKGGSPMNTPQKRYDAGAEFEDIFANSQSSGRDSLSALLGGGQRGHSGPANSTGAMRQAEALAMLSTLRQHMSRNDYKIIELVCGEGCQPPEAVRQVCRDYTDTAPARYREALDGLIDGFERMRGPRRR